MTDDVRPVQPIQASENYWSSDDQLYPTVGPDDSDIEAVEAASTETVRRVLKAVKSPSKVVDREADNPSSIPVRPDGSTGELPMMEIPGFGEEYSDCGKPMPMACSGCGHTATVGRTCRRSTCPRCGAAWVRDRAVNIAARLGATRAVRDSNRDEHQRYHHLAWMPPEDWRLEADDVLERTLHTIRDMMDALDIEGYVFYHPWSGSGHDDEQGDDRGKWKDRLFNGRDWRGDVREELNFRPHFHIVAVGHKVPGQDFTKTIYDKTGWILKRITKSEDSAVSIYNDEDLAKTVTYCLSHSAIDVNGGSDGSAQKTYRRYGRLVNSSEIEIDDAARDHHDQLVRRAATTTLGIPLKDQFVLPRRSAIRARNATTLCVPLWPQTPRTRPLRPLPAPAPVTISPTPPARSARRRATTRRPPSAKAECSIYATPAVSSTTTSGSSRPSTPTNSSKQSMNGLTEWAN